MKTGGELSSGFQGQGFTSLHIVALWGNAGLIPTSLKPPVLAGFEFAPGELGVEVGAFAVFSSCAPQMREATLPNHFNFGSLVSAKALFGLAAVRRVEGWLGPWFQKPRHKTSFKPRVFTVLATWNG